jgi:hypothetical protein
MFKCPCLVRVGYVEDGTGNGKCHRKFIRRGAVKVYGEVEVWINMFLPSALDDVEW